MSKSTQEKLIDAAIILCSQNDFDRISVQKINEIANVANKSALYYHFKSKWGLVEAALNHVLDPYIADAQQLLESLDPKQAEVAPIVDALMKPMIKILLGENGFFALKFFSRIVSAGDEGRILVAKKLSGIAIQTTNLLTQAIPDSEPDTMSIKVMFTFNSILNIISDGGLEKFWPTAIKDHKVIGQFLRDYIIGGITYNHHMNYINSN